MRRLSLVVVLAFLSSPALLFAAPIRWTLHDVRFSDGGTATGHIVIDLDLLRTQSPDGSSRFRIDDIAVTTKSGSDPSSTRGYRDGDGLLAEYLESASDSLGHYGLITLRSGTDPHGDPHVLLLYLAVPLSQAGGVIPIVTLNRRGLSGEYRANVLEGQRSIVGGRLVGSQATIPEPSLLMLLGVGGFAALRRRRQP